MDVVPVAIPFAVPIALMVAIDEELELQVTNAVRSSVLPSLKVPVAKKATDDPTCTVELDGVIDTPVSWDDGTVMVALPQIVPAQALMVEVPAAAAYTAPEFVESLVTVATVKLEEVHATAFNVWVVLSEYVPVAVKRCAVPSGIDALFGATEIDTRVAGAVEGG